MTDVLPSHLRTEHWYCDLHHTMLVIMFKRLVPALRGGNRHKSTYFVDTMTMYWLLHCLMEEEGFAHAVANGRADQDLVDRHAVAHLKLMESWRDTVFLPFKQGTTDDGSLADAADAYYKAVIRHIETMDQDTYGTAAEHHDARTRREEIAHIAQAGLPLTPFMDGAFDTTKRLAPGVAVALAPRHARSAQTSPVLLGAGATKGLRADISRALGSQRTPLSAFGRSLLAA